MWRQRFLKEAVSLEKLPVDKKGGTESRQVPDAIYALCEATSLEKPRVVALSRSALEEAGLGSLCDEERCAAVLSGNERAHEGPSYGHVYCGHQFGNFAGQLGDGAALTVGQVRDARGGLAEVQLKGAGPTPFSRRGDGRKVLRSSVREFLMSEAMHALGVPTARAAAVVVSESRVARDPQYEGRVVYERCAVLTRVAPSFLRFGSFEICREGGPSEGRFELLRALVDYAVEHHFADSPAARAPPGSARRVEELVRDVAERTARLVARWQCLGFCHGVLNTDNMSLHAITIDYGPFGMMEHFDRAHVCNASDRNGRYAYDQQPSICRENCRMLADALAPLAPDLALPDVARAAFDAVYDDAYANGMAAKLGLTDVTLALPLATAFLDILETFSIDFTLAFRMLCSVTESEGSVTESGETETEIDLLLEHGMLSADERGKRAQVNVTRERIDDLRALAATYPERMAALLGQQPLDLEAFFDRLVAQIDRAETIANATPDGARNALRSWLARFRAASSDEDVPHRVSRMRQANPAVILRNHLAQDAIDLAEDDDFSGIHNLLHVLQAPYDDPSDLQFTRPRSEQLIVT